MELSPTAMFVIALLILAGLGLFKWVRHATLQEAENRRLAEKVEDLEAKLAVKEPPVVIGPSTFLDTEAFENAMFLLTSGLKIKGYSDQQEREADEKFAQALQILIEWRGLDKHYKGGRNAK